MSLFFEQNHRAAGRRAPHLVTAEEPQRRRAVQRRLGSLSVRGERKGRVRVSAPHIRLLLPPPPKTLPTAVSLRLH